MFSKLFFRLFLRKHYGIISCGFAFISYRKLSSTLCIYSEPNRLFKDTSGLNCVGLFPPLKTTIWPNQAPFSYPLSPNVITSAHKYTAANLQSCSGHNRNYYLLLSLSLCFVQLFDLLSAQPCNFCAYYLW